MTITTFSNGVRAVVRRSDSPVSYIGAAVAAGSRDDGEGRDGLAHFVEHTLFKGTRRRSSWHISNRMESIGGELNAYTTKEETLIYTNAPAGYAPRAIELIADLIKNATFPTAEIERERDVIIEEIHSYADSPADAVYDEFDELLYAGSALSHNILGSEKSVKSLTGGDGRAFIDSRYTPANIVLYCVDPGNERRNLRLLECHFGDLSFSENESCRVTPAELPAFRETRDRGHQQANTIIGTRLFARNDPRRHALFLLNNILGGPCMNSRLNHELREKRGLVYTVDSALTLMSDCGSMLIYFGSQPDKVEKCSRIISDEISRLASDRLSPRAFAAARDQYCGQLTVSGDHRENCAMALAKSLLYFGEVHDIAHTAEQIRAVTPDDIRDMAALIASKELSRLTLT